MEMKDNSLIVYIKSFVRRWNRLKVVYNLLLRVSKKEKDKELSSKYRSYNYLALELIWDDLAPGRSEMHGSHCLEPERRT